MKITEEEREAAYELKWLIDEILMGRERAVLYRDIYAAEYRAHGNHERSGINALQAIRRMEKAFEPVCETCQTEAEQTQARAN